MDLALFDRLEIETCVQVYGCSTVEARGNLDRIGLSRRRVADYNGHPLDSCISQATSSSYTKFR